MVKVTAHTKEEAENCPVRSVLTKVTAKWNLLILLTLEDEELRFGELKRAIGDVTQRVLTENLRPLQRDGHPTAAQGEHLPQGGDEDHHHDDPDRPERELRRTQPKLTGFNRGLPGGGILRHPRDSGKEQPETPPQDQPYTDGNQQDRDREDPEERLRTTTSLLLVFEKVHRKTPVLSCSSTGGRPAGAGWR